MEQKDRNKGQADRTQSMMLSGQAAGTQEKLSISRNESMRGKETDRQTDTDLELDERNQDISPPPPCQESTQKSKSA